ncbi:hypothetical protein [Pseudonocardia sp. GCM10023141]|uniref:hypothetical protein n=1 Tax=Pseudonocardia sp. GCM10023141 TaxID=3252653 RepID=UPI003618803B
MCGSCGRRSVKDWTWPWLAGPRSAALVASAAQRLSTVRGIRVRPGAGGWDVALPTGARRFAVTLDELVRAADVDGREAPAVDVGATGSAPEPVVTDNRRSLTLVAAPGTDWAPGNRNWVHDLVDDPAAAAVPIDTADEPAALAHLHHVAAQAATAPFNEHCRIAPIGAAGLGDAASTPWPDLPDTITAADLAPVCVTLAARLRSLDARDVGLREARLGLGSGTVLVIQSCGAHVLLADRTPTGS